MNKPYEDIQLYLGELKTALQGQPAGLVQDALYDAESHFIDALANGEQATMRQLIDEFGSPQEIATQYIQFEKDSQRFLNGTPSKSPLFNGFFEPLSCFQDYKSLSYFFIAFPLSIVYFGWLMLFGLPALMLSILVVGLPFLALFLKTQPYLALFEGQLINTLLSTRMPRRPNRVTQLDGTGSRLWQKILGTLTSAQGWRVIVYSAVQLPLSATYFAAVCIVFIGSLALIVTPVLDPIIHAFVPHAAIDIDWYWFPATTIVGAIGLTLSLHIARLLTTFHSSIASYLLIRR